MQSVPPPGAWERVAFKDEGVEFNLASCNQHDLDPDEEQQIDESLQVAEDQGVLPGLSSPRAYRDLLTEVQVDGIGEDHQLPPWVRMLETYNLEAFVNSDSLASEEEFRYAVANPGKPKKAKVTRLPLDELYRRRSQGVKSVAEEYGLHAGGVSLEGKAGGNLIMDNAKLEKGGKYNWYSFGFSMAPNVLAGLGDVCPFRSKGCTIACLADSGQGEEFEGAKWGATAREARKRRTFLFMQNRDELFALIDRDLALKQKAIIEHGSDAGLSLRMNMLSDQPWEQMRWPDGNGKSLMERHPDIPFYDYTKNTSRMVNFLTNRGDWPENYHLTFSWSEINAAFCFWVLDHGGNVALPFDTPPNKSNTSVDRWSKLPYYFAGYKVIDADMTDLRFLDRDFFTDPEMVTSESSIKGQLDQNIIRDVQRELSEGRGLICGLRLKGVKAIKRHAEGKQRERAEGLPMGTYTSGFVAYADETEASNQDPEAYIEMLVNASEQRRAQQMAEKTDVDYPGDTRRKPFMGIAPKEEAMLVQEGRIGEPLYARRSEG